MSEREKLKKLAEEKLAYNCDPKNLGRLHKSVCVAPSTILALLSELEQAERERDEARHCTVCTWCGEIQKHDGVCTKSPVKQLLNTKLELQASEAALRTLRQASQRQVDMQQMSPAKYAEKYGLTLSLGVYVAEEKRVIAALAAALAAEGGE